MATGTGIITLKSVVKPRSKGSSQNIFIMGVPIDGIQKMLLLENGNIQDAIKILESRISNMKCDTQQQRKNLLLHIIEVCNIAAGNNVTGVNFDVNDGIIYFKFGELEDLEKFKKDFEG